MPNAAESPASRVYNIKAIAEQLARRRAEEQVPRSSDVDEDIAGIASNALRELRTRIVDAQPAAQEQGVREFLAFFRSELKRCGVVGDDADRIFDELLVRHLVPVDRGEDASK